MKTTLRSLLHSLSFGLVLLFTSCEKMDDPQPCQTFEESACTINGSEHFKLNDVINANSNPIIYRLNPEGDKLSIQFLNNGILQYPNTVLTTQSKQIAFTLEYKGILYTCDGSRTQGSYSNVTTDVDNWSRTFSFQGIDVISGKTIHVSGSMRHYTTGGCHDSSGGSGWSFNWG